MLAVCDPSVPSAKIFTGPTRSHSFPNPVRRPAPTAWSNAWTGRVIHTRSFRAPRTDWIEVVFGGKALFGPGVLIPPAAPHPRPRSCPPHGGSDQPHRLRERPGASQVNALQVDAAGGQVDMAVDKSWNNGPAT